MRPLNASVLFTVKCLCLLTVPVLLMSCANSTPLVIEPTPPLVNCEAGTAALLPPIPTDHRLEAEWMATVMGLYAEEVTKRKAVRDCLRELRRSGVIR